MPQPSVFCFNTTLRIWGLPGRRQKPGKSMGLIHCPASHGISGLTLDGYFVNCFSLDPRDHLAPTLPFRGGEGETQRKLELHQVTLKNQNPGPSIFLPLWCSFSHTIPQAQRLLTLQLPGWFSQAADSAPSWPWWPWPSLCWMPTAPQAGPDYLWYPGQ